LGEQHINRGNKMLHEIVCGMAAEPSAMFHQQMPETKTLKIVSQGEG
jgi:hypothetical protein